MQRGVDEDPWRLVSPDRRSAFNGTGSVMVSQPHVAVVDDDESVRESLPDLLRELGYEAKPFASAQDFLASGCIGDTRCLILDVSMPPGMSGPELQQELARRQHSIPIVFITATRDTSIRPQVIERGAVECLFKPFSDDGLLEALTKALGTRSTCEP